MTNFDKVKEFHNKFGVAFKNKPEFPDPDIVHLRVDLIEEELKELHEAIADNDIVEVADALTDLLYVVYGMGDVFGINLDMTFKEVHRSNMSKLGEDGKPVRREDGKVLKGPNYSPPDLKSIVLGDNDATSA
jgi:predicted HAD superfamily Cof-like phosphohydrolase